MVDDCCTEDDTCPLFVYINCGTAGIFSLSAFIYRQCVWQYSTWREERGEVVEDLRVSFPSCETDHGTDLQREGLQLLSCAQTVHFQHILHVVEETHKQVAGVRTGRKHWGIKRKGS